MGNEFSVTPATFNVDPIMQGIGSLVKQNREERKKEKTKQEFISAYQSGDPDAFALYMAENPDANDALSNVMKFRSDKTGANYTESVAGFLSNPTRENLINQIESRSQFVNNEGGSSAETQQAIEQFDANPEEFIKRAEIILASRDPKSYKAYKEGVGGAFGDFKTKKEALDVQGKYKTDFNKDVAPFRESVQYYTDSKSLTDKRGGIENLTGTDDFIIMRNLLKQSLPNESVMGDDIENLATSQGMPTYFKGLISKLQGKGAAPIEARKEIMQSMYNLAVTRGGERDRIRDQYATEIEGIKGIDSKFMREARPIDRLDWMTPPTTNAAGWKLQQDAQGNKAYVSPDGSQFEEIK